MRSLVVLILLSTAAAYGPHFQRVRAFGNGNNDALLLKTVKAAGGLAVAVDNGEGCSVEAIQNANIFIVGIVNALDLLIERTWCKTILRR